MKRSAAILGPTPAFLSWTLVLPCPFRDEDARNPVDAAFRELRSLRAIAVGEIEDRIIEGFCLHPDVATSEDGVTKGFPVDEVYATFGGHDEARKTCDSCPANVPVSTRELTSGAELSKAGCFGWLPFGGEHRDSANFLRLLEVNDQSSDQSDIVQSFDEAFRSAGTEPPFPKTSPAWFGVWSRKSFSQEQLVFLESVCARVKDNSISWARLVAAIKIACQQKAEFICSLTPRGNSDGTNWTIESQCANCGISRTASPCPSCRDDSPPLRSRRMKVLGMRPYLDLASIVGGEGASKLREIYRNRSAQETGDD